MTPQDLDVGPSPSHVDERTAGQPVPPRGAHPLATLPLAPSWARRTILHGLAGYGRGCRCPECRAAQKARMAAWRQRKAAA